MSVPYQKLAFTGERFVPEESGNIAIEHLHRYLSAIKLVKSKVVLDIASGEGYGSDLLAEHAAHVFGVDIAVDAIEHARGKYKRSNLEFHVGDCTHIPLADQSVDIIVSFETLEHYTQHDASFVEFKRVLKPGGKLLISSPDKKYYTDDRNFHNEFHLKELYEQEFRDLVGRHFQHASFSTQRIAFGSVILPLSTPAAAQSYYYAENEISSAPGIFKPLYLLALASDENLETLEAGIFEQPINETEIIQSWERVMAARDGELSALRSQLDSDRSHALEMQRRSTELAELNKLLLTSISWRVTTPLRLIQRNILKLLSLIKRTRSRCKTFGARLKNAFGYVRRGDFKGLVHRSLHYRQQAKVINVQQRLGKVDNTWGIMTTPHTYFIAECIAERLALRGINCVILTGPQNNFDLDFYIVLCAQMFEKLPPDEKRVIFQLEQSVSSRWFTPEYFKILENSVAVLEYSLVNISFLAENSIAYPHVFYLPIGTSIQKSPVTSQPEKKYDFVFYGDYYSSPRRGKMLDALKNRFSVKFCNNSFGNEMHEIIRSARAVINIHYYENALLEMPRIQECLSLGVPVLSESAQDQADYPELEGAVQFFEQNSIEDMLRAAEKMLQKSDSLNENIKKSAATSAARFTFMFDRFLTAIGALPAPNILDLPIYLPDTQPQIALSLPETIHRRNVFNQNRPQDCAIFDGIRNVKGWIGCGSSYNALARHARASKQRELTVFEDDVLFRDDHKDRLAKIRNYLAENINWDIFSGVIASVHAKTRVLNVEDNHGMTFVTLDRMTSTVFNIYNHRAIDILARWDPTNLDVDSNTIDRYLENQDSLRVVVTLPFLVGHREEVNSTLWGFGNGRYSTMIAEAEKTIQMLADEWLERNSKTIRNSSRRDESKHEMQDA